MNKLKRIFDILLPLVVYISFPCIFVYYTEKGNIIVEPFTNIEQMKIFVFLSSLLNNLFVDKVLAPFVIHIYDILKGKMHKKKEQGF